MSATSRAPAVTWCKMGAHMLCLEILVQAKDNRQRKAQRCVFGVVGGATSDRRAAGACNRALQVPHTYSH